MDPADAKHAAVVTALCRLVSLLVDKGAIREGDVVATFRQMSVELMDKPGGAHGVHLADMLCDAAEGKPERAPS